MLHECSCMLVQEMHIETTEGEQAVVMANKQEFIGADVAKHQC